MLAPTRRGERRNIVGKWGRIAGALGLVMALIAAPIRAQDVQAVQAVQKAVAQALVKGDTQGAFAAIDAAQIAQLDKVFLVAQVLQVQGRHAEAAALLAEVLALNPDLVLFRRALVRSLIALGDLDAAIDQIDILLQAENNPDERRRLLDLRARLDARRPGGLTFGVSLTPSTNVNRATSNVEAPLLFGLEGTIDETRESGVGLTLSFGGFRRHFLGQGRVIEGSLSTSYTAFSDSAYNRASVTGALAYSVPAQNGLWITRAAASAFLYRDETDDAQRFSLSQSRRWATESGRLWEVTGTVLHTDYQDPSSNIYDSNGIDLGAVTRRNMDGGRWLTLSFGLGYTDARDDRFSYLAPRVGAEYGSRVGDTWILSGGPVLSLKAYDEDFGLLTDGPREDVSYGLKLSVLNTAWRVRGAVPRLSCLAERTNSNVVFYDNRNVVECSIGLSRQF